MNKHKIVLVEDDLVQGNLIAEELTKSGFNVVRAADGRAGLDLILREHPDLIVLDIHMASINGYEFMRALRAHKVIEGKPMTPVIVLTVNETMEDLFRLEGIKGYFIKPVKATDLIQKIEECLGPNH